MPRKKNSRKNEPADQTLPLRTLPLRTNQQHGSQQEQVPPGIVVPINVKKLESSRKDAPTFAADFKEQDSKKLNDQTTPSEIHPSPTQQLRFGNIGAPANICSNYIVASKLPKALYQYDIAYGTVRKPADSDASQASAASSSNSAKPDTSRTADVTAPNDAEPSSGRVASVLGPQVRDVEAKNEKERIFRAVEKVAPLSACGHFATDYTTLWTIRQIPLDANEAKEVTDLSYEKPNGNTLKVSFVRFSNEKKFDLGQGSVSLVGVHKQGEPHASEAIAALNSIVFRHIKQNSDVPITPVGSNKFFVDGGYIPMGILNAVRGYYTSVRPGYNNVFINISPATAAFYHPMVVWNFLDSVERNLSWEYPNPKSLLVNRKVRIMYDLPKRTDQPANANDNDARKRTIAEFGMLPCNGQEFTTKEGRTLTVDQYFAETYGIKLKHPESFPVNVGLRPDKETIAARKKYDNAKVAAREVPNKRAIWIPSELLELEPGQIFARTLGKSHIKQMIQHGRHSPALNQHLVQDEALPIMGITTAKSQLGELQMTADNRLIKLPGRIMDAPKILYKTGNGNVSGTLIDPAKKASWDLRNQDKFFRRPLKDGLGVRILHLNSHTWAGSPKAIYEKLLERIKIRVPECRETAQPTSWQNVESLKIEHLGKILRYWGAPSVVFVILPGDKSVEPFGEVKRILDQKLGIQSICMTEKKMEARHNQRTGTWVLDDSTFDSLALKFNLRHRGQNHQVMLAAKVYGRTVNDIRRLSPQVPKQTKGESAVSTSGSGSKEPDLSFPGDKGKQKGLAGPTSGGLKTVADTNQSSPAFQAIATDTIIMGADVTHPSPGAVPGCPSIAAVVANTDANVANFAGSMRLQEGRKEIIVDMKDMVLERLSAWSATREGKLPARVLFYRDGVSESQYDEVKQVELQAIKDAFIAKDVKAPEIIFIVCGKRHHTRFYPGAQSSSYLENAGRNKWNGNVKPGLVVDRVITRPPADKDDGTFDFFLQSHGAMQGTARSCHYVVLENGKDWKAMTASQIQALTLALCYSYPTATKGVSYAAPAYLADRLCERGRVYLAPLLSHDASKLQTLQGVPQQGEQDPDETIQAFRRRMAVWMADQPEWKSVDSSGPWHKNLEGSMFYV